MLDYVKRHITPGALPNTIIIWATTGGIKLDTPSFANIKHDMRTEKACAVGRYPAGPVCPLHE